MEHGSNRSALGACPLGVKLEVLMQPSAAPATRIASAEDKDVFELLEEYAAMYGMAKGAKEAAAKALQV